MNPLKLFSDFVNVLQKRTLYLTEDSIRFLFFSCLLHQDHNPNHYVLELPYIQMFAGNSFFPNADWKKLNPNNNGWPKQELDLYYQDTTNICNYCFEFKFHRAASINTPYIKSTSKPRPLMAGSIFNDIHRLQLIHSIMPNSCIPVRKFLVYVTDALMDNYLGHPSGKGVSNPYRTNLKTVYSLPLNNGMRISIINNTTTFGKASYHSIIPTARPMTVNIVNRCFTDLINVLCPSLSKHECHIRIFEIVDSLLNLKDVFQNDKYLWIDNYEKYTT